MTPPTIPAIAPDPAAMSAGPAPEQAQGSGDGFAAVLGEFSGSGDSPEGEGTTEAGTGSTAPPTDASASVQVAAEVATTPVQATQTPVVVAPPPLAVCDEAAAVTTATVAATAPAPAPAARVAPTPPGTAEQTPDGHAGTAETGAAGAVTVSAAPTVSLEIEAAPATAETPSTELAPAAVPTDAEAEDQPDEQGRGLAKGRPDHARAHDVPGQAKEPGTEAGRSLTDAAQPAGDAPDHPPADATADTAPAPAPHRSTAEPAQGPRRQGLQTDETATAAARTDTSSAAAPAAPPTHDAAAGTDLADVHARRGHEAGPTRAHVALSDLATEAGASIRLATRGGFSSAQISLTPPELGQVEIRLRYRGGAVVAELTADSAQAAQTLARASAELRRSLEEQGIVVLSLDVRQTGPDARSDHSQGRDHSPSGSGGSLGGRPDGESDEVTAVTPARAPSMTAGIQIDVLA